MAVTAGSALDQGPAPKAANGSLLATNAALFSTIQGTALNWTNGPMQHSRRLRDARLGRVVDTMTTDRLGAFEFHALEPGSYVVE